MIEDYVLKMKQFADQLHAAGQHLSDEDLVLYILGGLSSEFDSVVVNLTPRSNSLSLSDVQFALQTQEMRLQQLHLAENSTSQTVHPPSMSLPSANVASKLQFFSNSHPPRGGYHPRARGRGRHGRGNKLLCQIYGKSNHLASKCYKQFDVDFPGLDSPSPSQNLSSPMAFQAHHVTAMSHIDLTNHPTHPTAYTSTSFFPGQIQPIGSASSQSTDGDWYVDSDATHHVTANLNNLSLQAPYHGQEFQTSVVDRNA